MQKLLGTLFLAIFFLLGSIVGFLIPVSSYGDVLTSGTTANSSEIIADSQNEFSGIQGQDNWFYGYYTSCGNSSTFTQMTYDTQGYWEETETQPPWTLLRSSGGNPSADHCAVRRWVSEVNGNITIAGKINKNDISGGDGITGSILVDGAEVWSQYIAYNDSTGVTYEVNATVNVSSLVDFVISPGGSEAYDTSDFTATISGSGASSLEVNLTGDESDADLTDGICDIDLLTDGNQCTLRAAIQEANSREGEDTITFESSVSAISPEKPLPDITETVTIDASSQSSSNVEVNGSNAGKNADGFSLKKGNLTIKNLTISGFSENGVKSDGNGYVLLENVIITGNGRYGILVDGAVYINSDPSNNAVLSPTSTTTSVISGNGGTGDGGGVWSSKDSVNAAYVEIKDNKGPAVAAKKNIALESFTISGNKGPGVQSLSGGISVYGTSDHSEENTVMENQGPGIMAGTDMELKPIGSGKGKAKGSITIQTDINVSKNGGWGIIAPGGDVAVNRIDATGDWGAVGSSTSVISDNGNKTLECYTLNDKGKLVRISSEALESSGAGGIGAGGNMAGAILEVTENNGAGIVAKDNVNLKQLKVNNNRGPGIQSRKGSITINGTSDNSEENQVMENQGPGVMSGTNMALKPVGSSKNIAKGSVTITTDINVSTNGGWGIIAPEGDVAVNRIDARGTTGKISSSTSIITGNGDKNRKCYVVGENGRLKQISSKSLESAGAGGIGAGANMAGELLEITENNGPGIAVKEDIDVAQVKANNNKGPGIQSLQGTIGINNGTSDYNEENYVTGNQGPGVMTGTEMSLSTAKFGKNIYFRTHVEVSGNAGWGIFSSLGDVVINGYDYETQGRLSPYTSYVKENGDTSLSCYVVNKKGYLSRLKKYSAGGIACGKDLAGYDLEVTDNSGTGIKVLNDLYMDTGKVCDNSEENLSVTGDIVNITDVEVCE